MSTQPLVNDRAEDSLQRPIMVVSNREPYLHSYADDGAISWAPTTGGVAVALDALMRERGGVWIAHGNGSADRAVVDAGNRVMVPPDNPTYPLRRVWLSAEEEAHYYTGFANEGLWPLCHEAHVRPMFRAVDWASYRRLIVGLPTSSMRSYRTTPRRCSFRIIISLSSGRGFESAGRALNPRFFGTFRGLTQIVFACARGDAKSWRDSSRTI